MVLNSEKIVLNEERNVSLVKILQISEEKKGTASKHPAVLILPGGGYDNCSEHEAEAVAYRYLDAGYQAFVLRYSVSQHKTWPNPLNDYEKAMKLIRDNADEWCVLKDRIAVIGFSAGGHLAACAATASVNRPNAAILGYAATGAELTILMHPGTSPVVPVEKVDSDTCPCFIFAARDDTLVPVKNTLDFEQALTDNGIMFESHVYLYGGHGFSTCSSSYWSGKVCSRVPRWVRDSIEWLEDMFGKVTPNGMTDPVCSAKINGDYDSELSVSCTIAHLKKQGENAVRIIKPVLEMIEKTFAAFYPDSNILLLLIDCMQLDMAMKVIKTDESEIAIIDAELKKIPNIR